MILRLYFLVEIYEVSVHISQLLAMHSLMHKSLLKLIIRSAGGPNLTQGKMYTYVKHSLICMSHAEGLPLVQFITIVEKRTKKNTHTATDYTIEAFYNHLWQS